MGIPAKQRAADNNFFISENRSAREIYFI